MSAPSSTQWGDIVGSGSGQGRIGAYVTSSSTQTNTTVTMQVWFWTKYGVQDSYNDFNYSFTDTGVINIGSKNIVHSNNSGSGWSTNNQTHIGTYSKTYSRGTSSRTISCAADFSGFEVISGSGWVDVKHTIPVLNKYTITYNANGGTGAPSSHSYFYGYDTTLSSMIPTKTGYKFLGWSLSSTATSPSYQPGQKWGGTNASNYTLYAVWELIRFNLTYDAGANGGVILPENTPTKTIRVAYRDEIGNLPSASKPNHKLVEWNYNSDGSGNSVYSHDLIFKDTTIYAQFKLNANCHIKIDKKYKLGLMCLKINGQYKIGTVFAKKDSKYMKSS